MYNGELGEQIGISVVASFIIVGIVLIGIDMVSHFSFNMSDGQLLLTFLIPMFVVSAIIYGILDRYAEREWEEIKEGMKKIKPYMEMTKKDYDRWIDGSFEEFVKTDPLIQNSLPLGQNKFRYTVDIGHIFYQQHQIEVFVDHNGIIYEITYPTFHKAG